MNPYNGEAELLSQGVVICRGKALLEDEADGPSHASGWKGTFDCSGSCEVHQWSLSVLTLRLRPSGEADLALVFPSVGSKLQVTVMSAPHAPPFWSNRAVGTGKVSLPPTCDGSGGSLLKKAAAAGTER